MSSKRSVNCKIDGKPNAMMSFLSNGTNLVTISRGQREGALRVRAGKKLEENTTRQERSEGNGRGSTNNCGGSESRGFKGNTTITMLR